MDQPDTAATPATALAPESAVTPPEATEAAPEATEAAPGAPVEAEAPESAEAAPEAAQGAGQIAQELTPDELAQLDVFAQQLTQSLGITPTTDPVALEAILRTRTIPVGLATPLMQFIEKARSRVFQKNDKPAAQRDAPTRAELDILADQAARLYQLPYELSSRVIDKLDYIDRQKLVLSSPEGAQLIARRLDDNFAQRGDLISRKYDEALKTNAGVRVLRCSLDYLNEPEPPLQAAASGRDPMRYVGAERRIWEHQGALTVCMLRYLDDLDAYDALGGLDAYDALGAEPPKYQRCAALGDYFAHWTAAGLQRYIEYLRSPEANLKQVLFMACMSIESHCETCTGRPCPSGERYVFSLAATDYSYWLEVARRRFPSIRTLQFMAQTAGEALAFELVVPEGLEAFTLSIVTECRSMFSRQGTSVATLVLPASLKVLETCGGDDRSFIVPLWLPAEVRAWRAQAAARAREHFDAFSRAGSAGLSVVLRGEMARYSHVETAVSGVGHYVTVGHNIREISYRICPLSVSYDVCLRLPDGVRCVTLPCCVESVPDSVECLGHVRVRVPRVLPRLRQAQINPEVPFMSCFEDALMDRVAAPGKAPPEPTQRVPRRAGDAQGHQYPALELLVVRLTNAGVLGKLPAADFGFVSPTVVDVATVLLGAATLCPLKTAYRVMLEDLGPAAPRYLAKRASELAMTHACWATRQVMHSSIANPEPFLRFLSCKNVSRQGLPAAVRESRASPRDVLRVELGAIEPTPLVREGVETLRTILWGGDVTDTQLRRCGSAEEYQRRLIAEYGGI